MTKDEALDLALEALKDRSSLMKWQKAITAIKQARALDKKAENARELGLDYEPAEVLGHNGWGFPIKAAAPVQEDWGPGPHEYHSLTAAQRQWVDLTDEEIYALESATDTLEFPQTVKAIEAKLRSKNNDS
jgi:hypothetical protein